MFLQSTPDPSSASDVGSFAGIAEYLQDPLVLIGFVLFLAFLFARQLLERGIIPPLGQTAGASILRAVLQYGFILALLVIILGFALRYRQLQEDAERMSERQRAAADLIHGELCADRGVMRELAANVATLRNAVRTVSNVLRDERFVVTHTLFGDASLRIDSDPASAAVALTRMEALEASAVLDHAAQLNRHQQFCGAVTGTLGRTRTSVASLSDAEGTRYRIARSSWDANQASFSSLANVDAARTADLYERMATARRNYTRLSEQAREFLDAVAAFCAAPRPTRELVSAALASEQLNIESMEEFSTAVDRIVQEVASVGGECPADAS